MSETSRPITLASGTREEPSPASGPFGTASAEAGRRARRHVARASASFARRAWPLAAHGAVDRVIVDLWGHGIRVQGEIGRQIGLDQRSVSRRIARMLRLGTWPFERPARGRAQVPVAAGFVVVPVPRARPPADD